jgi:para-aminobenzoate synthetase component 1
LTGFQKISQLAGASMPFVFFVSFDKRQVMIFTTEEAEKAGIRFEVNHQKWDSSTKLHTIQNLNPLFIDEESYKIGFDLVVKNIFLGNSYLLNYTLCTPVYPTIRAEEIFLISKAKYKAIFPGKFVFFSPETFIQINSENRIFTFPMKGTSDIETDSEGEILLNNSKENAEHSTIVDLMRNDLALVASDIKVDQFKYIEPIIAGSGKRLWQMSSAISGQLSNNWKNRLGEILFALLPAGSISGAPKQKTLEIINEAEACNRGFYTGIAGIFDGNTLDTCVMIRFIDTEKEQYVYHSGGGITSLSDYKKEYNEYKQKIYIPVF